MDSFGLDPSAATGLMQVDPSAQLHPHSCQWGFTLRPGNGVQDQRETCSLRATCEEGKGRSDGLMETSGHLILDAFTALFDGSNIT